MIFEETILKATQIDEMMAYLCGFYGTSIEKVMLESAYSSVEIDPADCYDAKITEHDSEEIILVFKNGRTEIIKTEYLTPGITHYILVKEESGKDELGYISGVV
jgi:hypothetical protein